jgi:thiol-disulfide isomerase/thioredoxin
MWTLMLTAAPAAAEDPPAVSLEWRKADARVVVAAPQGEKVAADAPARLVLAFGDRALEVSGDGALLSAGVSVADLRGAAVEGTLDVSLCDLAGTTCRPTSWRLGTPGAVPGSKRGSLALDVAEPTGEDRPFGPDATADAAEAAFARAKASGKQVLLDFSAVWCPPCNQLAEEVLEAQPRVPELDGFEIAVVDVDHPSSFALKDRYGVTGYPTVVVTDPEGEERTRSLGYLNRAAFLQWLAGAATATDAAELRLSPEELAPERAAELAWIMAQRYEHEQAEVLIARAETSRATEGLVDLRLARFAERRTPADLEWLLANAPDRAMDYALASPTVAEAAPEAAHRAVAAALRQARGSDVAAALTAASELASEPEVAQLFVSGAVGAVRSVMNGDPVHDKPYLGWLAHLMEDAGDPDGAVALLEAAVPAHPDEPTVDLALAPLLSRLERHEEALASADRAVARSWGDNRLRAVAVKAEALIAAGRGEEARAFARQELEAQPAPDGELDVRTHGYRETLEELADGGGRAAKK